MNGLTIEAYCPECNKPLSFFTTNESNDITCSCGLRLRLTIENGTGRVNALGEWADPLEPKKPETKPARRVSKKQVKK